MRNTLSNSVSNLRTCGALFARSFKSGTFSRNSGRGVLARGGCRSHDTVLFGTGRGLRLNLEPLATPFRVFAISSGYRGFTSVLQNSPSRRPDELQIITPRSISFQALHVLKRNVEFFRDVRKSFRGSRNA